MAIRWSPGCLCCDEVSSSSNSYFDPCGCQQEITIKATYEVDVLADLYVASPSLIVRGHSALTGVYEHVFDRYDYVNEFVPCSFLPNQSVSEFVATTETRPPGGSFANYDVSVSFSISAPFGPLPSPKRLNVQMSGFYSMSLDHLICPFPYTHWVWVPGFESVPGWVTTRTINDNFGTPVANTTLTIEVIQLP